MATEVTCIVDPDAGAGYHYLSLAAALIGEAGGSPQVVTGADLAANDEQLTFENRSSSGSADTSPAEVSGFTVSADCFIKIHPSHYAGPVWDAGKPRLVVTGSGNKAINIGSTGYIRILGMQLHRNADAGVENGVIWLAANPSGGSAVVVAGNLIRGNGQGVGNYSAAIQPDFNVTPNLFVLNNVIADVGAASGNPSGGVVTMGGGTGRVWNNTIVRSSNGVFARWDSGTDVRNNLCIDNYNADFAAPFGWGSQPVSNNASSDATAPGDDSLINLDSDDVFVDAANGDFRLKDTAPVIDAGADLSSVLPAYLDWVDIIGTTRPQGSGADIGAFEYLASAPGELAPAPAHHGVYSLEIQLIQGHVLSVGGAHHGHTAEAADLVQAVVLAVAGALHEHLADAVELTQAHVLSVVGALHGHTAAAVVLTQAGLLDVLAAWHGHTSTAPAVTTEAMLDVGAAHHGHSAQEAQLTQAHILVVGDAVHGHRVESVTLSEALLLEIGNALHGHTAGGVTLTQAHVLAVAGAVHALTSDAIDGMPVDAVLVVSDALHGHIAQQVTLFDPLATVDLGDRIFVVQAEDRLFVVAPETRIGRVH